MIKIGNMVLKNPIMPASGTFGYGIEFKDFFDLNSAGAIVTKGISLQPKIGNPPPRLFEDGDYLMNYIGLENVGFERFVKEKLPFLKSINTSIIVNFFGNSEEEYIELAEKLNNLEGVDAVEVNVSCPNVKKGGIEFGLIPDLLFNLIKKIKKVVINKTLIVKISPIISDIILIGKGLEEAGADAITAINTLKGSRFNFKTGKWFTGGISGKLLKPVALRIVKELAQNLSIPIIGCGGIECFDDVEEFLNAGASAVQIGTRNFIEPDIIGKLANEYERRKNRKIN